MSFFDSEVVRAEMAEISELQEEVYKSVFLFFEMSKKEKMEHVDLLETLLNKQRVLYTRLSLSDDPEAITMKEQIIQSAQMMGLGQSVDMNVIFGNMAKLVTSMRDQIDNSELND